MFEDFFAETEPRDLMIIGALAVGMGYGVVGRLSGFCFRAALLEMGAGRPYRQLRAWALAIAVALIGTQGLVYSGILDISETMYLTSPLLWGGAVLGGLLFGFGMMLTRGCGGRHLVLAAGGNLRGVAVLLIMAVTAYMTMRGLLAVLRTGLTDIASTPVETQGLNGLLGRALDFDATTLGFGIALVVGLPLAVFAFTGAAQDRSRGVIIAGAAIGLLIPAAWLVTGVLAVDEFEPAPVQALTFTGPVGDSLVYLMTYTGASANFGIIAVGGTLLGSLTVALLRRDFVLQGFENPGQMLRYGTGAALMGFGGVAALGCTIGQGLSGLSTLSVGSILSIGAIAVGGLLGRRWLARNDAPAAAIPVPAE
ncbi:MAG: YeeE/YedE family protein [Rhodospirillales bacterium]